MTDESIIKSIKSQVFKNNTQDFSIDVTNRQFEIDSVDIARKTLTSEDYHASAIKILESALKWAMIIFGVVTLFLCFIIILIIFYSNITLSQKLIPTIATCFAEFLSVTVILIIKSLLKSKDKHFEQCEKDEEFDKIIALIERTKDKETRNKMLLKLVNSYCDKKNNKK